MYYTMEYSTVLTRLKANQIWMRHKPGQDFLFFVISQSRRAILSLDRKPVNVLPKL
jgi:hypothetical protein